MYREKEPQKKKRKRGKVAEFFMDVVSGRHLLLSWRRWAGWVLVATIIVEPVGSIQESSLAVDSMVFIPDGPYCTTQCYSSSVNFTSFPPAATITQASDILGVRLNIEHSFIGDINISLICPNNHSVLLMPDHNGNNGYYFGLYYEPDGSYCNASHPLFFSFVTAALKNKQQ